jgi:predicted amidophosphoribosyltransferase
MLSYLYCCYFCGKPLFKKSFVCAACLEIPTLQVRNERGLTHEYVFEYNSYSEVFIKNFKYGDFKSVVNQVSFRFTTEEACIVALPNSKNLKGDQNHSYVLARSIFPTQQIHEPFEKLSEKQARRSKGDRRNIRLKQVQALDTRNKLVVFIDDLLTTGSTIERAWKLLGKPRAKIITLCYTPKIKRQFVTDKYSDSERIP